MKFAFFLSLSAVPIQAFGGVSPAMGFDSSKSVDLLGGGFTTSTDSGATAAAGPVFSGGTGKCDKACDDLGNKCFKAAAGDMKKEDLCFKAWDACFNKCFPVAPAGAATGPVFFSGTEKCDKACDEAGNKCIKAAGGDIQKEGPCYTAYDACWDKCYPTAIAPAMPASGGRPATVAGGAPAPAMPASGGRPATVAGGAPAPAAGAAAAGAATASPPKPAAGAAAGAATASPPKPAAGAATASPPAGAATASPPAMPASGGRPATVAGGAPAPAGR